MKDKDSKLLSEAYAKSVLNEERDYSLLYYPSSYEPEVYIMSNLQKNMIQKRAPQEQIDSEAQAVQSLLNQAIESLSQDPEFASLELSIDITAGDGPVVLIYPATDEDREEYIDEMGSHYIEVLSKEANISIEIDEDLDFDGAIEPGDGQSPGEFRPSARLASLLNQASDGNSIETGTEEWIEIVSTAFDIPEKDLMNDTGPDFDIQPLYKYLDSYGIEAV